MSNRPTPNFERNKFDTPKYSLCTDFLVLNVIIDGPLLVVVSTNMYFKQFEIHVLSRK